MSTLYSVLSDQTLNVYPSRQISKHADMQTRRETEILWTEPRRHADINGSSLISAVKREDCHVIHGAACDIANSQVKWKTLDYG